MVDPEKITHGPVTSIAEGCLRRACVSNCSSWHDSEKGSVGFGTLIRFAREGWQIRPMSNYLSEATKRRSRCGLVRGRPVLSSHFSPGFAPHVGQRTAKVSFFLTFIAP